MNKHAKQIIDSFFFSNKKLNGIVHGYQSHRYSTSNVSNRSDILISQYGPSSATTKVALSTTVHSECEFWLRTSNGIDILLKSKEPIPVTDGQEYTISFSEAGSATTSANACAIEMACKNTGRTIFLSGMGDHSLGYSVLLHKDFEPMNEKFSKNAKSIFNSAKEGAWSIFRKELPAVIKIMGYAIPALIIAGILTDNKIFYMLAAVDFIYLIYNNQTNPKARDLGSHIAEKGELFFSNLEIHSKRI